MQFSLKRNEIIRKNNDIKNLYSNGNKITGKYVIIYFYKGNKRKVAFIVSKKLDKRAVVRNRIKRWLREIYRHGKFQIINNVELLVIARYNILNTEYRLLEDEIEKLFNNINYIIN
jgi:ribonuclease P protein component